MSDEILDYLERLSLDELVVLDSACEKFKSARETGTSTDPENFLSNSSGFLRVSLLLELLRTEIDLRLEAGDSPTLEEYAARYPEHSPALKRIFLEQESESVRKKETLVSRSIAVPTEFEGKQLVGTMLGHYRVESVIGVGGMGLVLEAQDTKLDRKVAIKLPSKELLENKPVLSNFVREAKVAASVRHANIVTIYSVEDGQDRPFLVMERVEGVSLEDYIRKHGPMHAEQVIDVGWQIANGLSAAHESGLVHHDIKPSNFLLEPVEQESERYEEDLRYQALRVKLTDFGLAQSMVHAMVSVPEDREGCVVGTPLYMSPEQASGAATDARSDLFSFGSVLYFLCTGKPAFRASRVEQVLRNVRLDEPVPLRQSTKGIPEELVAIIERLMSKDPDRRYQTAREVAQAFRDLQKVRGTAGRDQRQILRGWRGVTASILLVGLIAIVSILVSPLRDRWGSGQRSGKGSDATLKDLQTQTPIWSAPTKVQFVDENSEGSNPSLTADGKRLFFVSRSRGAHRVYEAKRESIDSPFEVAVPVSIPAPQDDPEEQPAILDAGTPCISADGLTLLFYSMKYKGLGGSDLWETRRASLDAPWEPMRNLGEEINSHYHEFAPGLSADGLSLYWFRADSEDNSDIWMAKRSEGDARFEGACKVEGVVNTITNEHHPRLSADGLTLYFDRGTPDPRLWQAHREDLTSEFSKAVRIPLPPEWDDQNAYAPTFANDDQLLVFTSNRIPGKQGFDSGELWQSRRISSPDAKYSRTRAQ